MAEAEAKVEAVMGREKWAKSRVINGGGGGIPTQNSPKNAVVPPHIAWCSGGKQIDIIIVI